MFDRRNPQDGFPHTPSPEDWAEYEAYLDLVEVNEVNAELTMLANSL